MLVVLLGTSLSAELIISLRWRHSIEQRLTHDTEIVLQQRSEHLAEFIENARKSMRLMAASGVPRHISVTQILTLLRAANKSQSQFSNLFDSFTYVTLQGTVYVADGKTFSGRDRPYFHYVQEGKESPGTLLISRITGQPVFVLHEPLRDSQGQLCGAMVGTLQLPQLLAPIVRDLTVPEAGVVVLDAEDRVLSSSLKENAPTFARPNPATSPVTASFLPLLGDIPMSPTVGGKTVTIGAQRFRIFYTRVPSLDWRIIYVEPEAELLKPLNESMRLVWGLEGALVLLAALTLLLAHRYLLTPMQALGVAHAALQEGDYSVRASVIRRDELGQLAESFNRMASALDTSTKRFRAVFEAFPRPIVLARATDFRYLDVNPAFLELYGTKREAVIGKTMLELDMAVDPEAVRQGMKKLMATGHLQEAVLQIKRPDGGRFWVSISSRFIDVNGEKLLLSSSADITHLKELEDSLRESVASAQKFHFMVDNANDALLMVDDRTFIECNPAALELYGCTRDEFIGHTPMDFSPPLQPDGRDSIQAAIAYMDAAMSGVAQRFEWLHHKQDGTPFYAEVSLRRYNEGGKYRSIAVVRDISLRKQTEVELQELNASLEERVEARTRELAERNADLAQALETLELARTQLAESEKRLRLVMTVTGDGIWDLDALTNNVYCSPRMCEIFGLPPDINHMHIDRIFGMIAEPDRARAREAVGRCLQGLEPFRDEHRICRADGSVNWVLACGASVESDAEGHPLRLVGNVSDITVRKQAELALKEAKAQAEAANVELAAALDHLRRVQDELVRSEKMAALGALVAGIAHELNTPIGNAVTVASTLLDEQRRFAILVESGLTRKALAGFLEMVSETGQSLDRNLRRAVELVGSFKQLAADQSSDQRRRFDLREVVQEVMLAMGPSIRKSRRLVHAEISEGLTLDSFPGPLGQILMNLINNALIHAFEGRESGNIWIRAGASEPGFVWITLGDDGCGIAAEMQARIFDPFFTTKMGQGSSGLGLHIVYNLVVNLLGGRIEVHSAPGKGAVFELRIPVSAPAPKQRAKN
jgi:PAS domain S-box-containing protein